MDDTPSKTLQKKGRGRPKTGLPTKTERVFFRTTQSEHSSLYKRFGADINGECRKYCLEAAGVKRR